MLSDRPHRDPGRQPVIKFVDQESSEDIVDDTEGGVVFITKVPRHVVSEELSQDRPPMIIARRPRF